MPKISDKRHRKTGTSSTWRLHDTYFTGVSHNRIVTRSQTAFLRVKNTDSDLDLFSDPSRQEIPGEPHMMEILKGLYGSIPRTIMTRRSTQHLIVSDDLCKNLDLYKTNLSDKKKGSKISTQGENEELLSPNDKKFQVPTSEEEEKQVDIETLESMSEEVKQVSTKDLLSADTEEKPALIEQFVSSKDDDIEEKAPVKVLLPSDDNEKLALEDSAPLGNVEEEKRTAFEDAMASSGEKEKTEEDSNVPTDSEKESAVASSGEKVKTVADSDDPTVTEKESVLTSLFSNTGEEKMSDDALEGFIPSEDELNSK
ncbi:uncharacterized protein TNIN_379581 [Trichonephila inaurata madagascariensis]|uniref:Uncharacterized protein n=1 Tax=Trichonephila inaurata madagascariensis TaxID=2747483 RepID=A0A8X6XYS7_9ARAC|nr:uncharacterized protein TNIN_379581 [Trichonephila inaurata madagascariensis]